MTEQNAKNITGKILKMANLSAPSPGKGTLGHFWENMFGHFFKRILESLGPSPARPELLSSLLVPALSRARGCLETAIR